MACMQTTHVVVVQNYLYKQKNAIYSMTSKYVCTLQRNLIYIEMYRCQTQIIVTQMSKTHESVTRDIQRARPIRLGIGFYIHHHKRQVISTLMSTVHINPGHIRDTNGVSRMEETLCCLVDRGRWTKRIQIWLKKNENLAI